MTNIASTVPKYVGDDWVFPFSFTSATGSTIDMSLVTFSASLIIETPYTTYAITGANGSIDVSSASSGVITVIVSNTLTSTLAPDMGSPFVSTDGRVTFPTRLALIATSPTINTDAIVPVKVIRR
jgi:hypothetical protein